MEGLIDILFFLFIFILEADIASRFRPKYKIMKMENEFFFFFSPYKAASPKKKIVKQSKCFYWLVLGFFFFQNSNFIKAGFLLLPGWLLGAANAST